MLAQPTSPPIPPTCRDVIARCDAVIDEQGKQIWVREQEIEMMADIITSQHGRLESANAWYNSKILWFVVGAGTAGYLLRK